MKNNSPGISFSDFAAFVNGYLVAWVIALVAVRKVFHGLFPPPGIRHGIVGYANYFGYPFRQETASFAFFLFFVPAFTFLFWKIHQSFNRSWSIRIQTALFILVAAYGIIGYLDLMTSYFLSLLALCGGIWVFRTRGRRIWGRIPSAIRTLERRKIFFLVLLIITGILSFSTLFFTQAFEILPRGNRRLLFWFLFFGVVYAFGVFLHIRRRGEEGSLEGSAKLLAPLTLVLFLPLLHRFEGPKTTLAAALLIALLTAFFHLRRFQNLLLSFFSARFFKVAFYIFIIPTLLTIFCIDWGLTQGRYVDFPIGSFDWANILCWDNEILGGNFPWRDFYYPYGINIFFRGLLVGLFNDHYAGITLYQNLASAATSVLVFITLAELLQWKITLLLVAFASYFIVGNEPNWNFRISFGLLSLSLLWRAHRNGGHLPLAGAGISAGIAFLFSPEVGLATVLCALPAIAISNYFRESSPHSLPLKILKGWGLWGLGFAIVLLPFTLYLQTHGALGPFFSHSLLSIFDADDYGKLPHAFFLHSMRLPVSWNGLYRMLFLDSYYAIPGYLGVSLFPLLLVTASICYLAFCFRRHTFRSVDFNLIVLLGMTLLQYKNVLTRSDGHVLTIVPFSFLLLVALIACTVPLISDGLRRFGFSFLVSKPFGILAFFIVLQFPEVKYFEKFENALNSKLNWAITSLASRMPSAKKDVNSFLACPGNVRGFNFYFSPAQKEDLQQTQKEIQYLQPNVLSQGGFYSYPYSSKYYFLLAQNSKTSYGPQAAYNAHRPEHQKAIVSDLQKRQVSYIIHEESYDLDGVPVSLRYAELDRFVFENFQPIAVFPTFTLLKKNLPEVRPSFKDEVINAKVLRGWDFEQGLSGWAPLHGIQEWSVRNGELSMVVTQDPAMVTPIDLEIPPNTFLIVSMKTEIRSPIEVFLDFGQGFVHDSIRHFTLFDSNYCDYVFALPAGKRLRQLRLDPVAEAQGDSSVVTLRTLRLVQLANPRSTAAILHQYPYYARRLFPLNFGMLPYALGCEKRKIASAKFPMLLEWPHQSTGWGKEGVTPEGGKYVEFGGMHLPVGKPICLNISTNQLKTRRPQKPDPLLAIFWDKGEGYQDFQTAYGRFLSDGKEHDYIFEIFRSPSWYFDQRAITGLKILLKNAENSSIVGVKVFEIPNQM